MCHWFTECSGAGDDPILGRAVNQLPTLIHDVGDVGTTVELKQTRRLGIVPGTPQLGLATWLVADLALVLVITPVLKRSW